MDFNLPGEEDPRRTEVRAWFEANPKPTYRQIAERGYTAPHWPRPWGLDADPELQYIIDTEIERTGMTPPAKVNGIATNQCGQALLHFGTDAQRQRFIPPGLACEEIWCMLFSEPSGGSDLGAIRTSARRDGDNYIIKGHKIWTSIADHSDIGVLIARTDPTAPKHKGLSQFLIDMKAPGVTVRPIADLTGEENEYNEVFLDEVRVPADRLLGREGDGWRIVMSQLQTERMMMTQPAAVFGAGPTARELMSGLIQTGRIKDPLIRDEAARLYIEGELCRLLSLRSLSRRMQGQPAGVEGNLGKMIAAPHGQRICDLAKRSQGPGAMVRNPNVLPLPDKSFGRFQDWDYAYWFSPAGTLGVGTQEVLKNVVSERILGLPRELDPTADFPFNQVAVLRAAS